MIQVKIITPDATLFEGDATEVTLPGANGSFQVLTQHAPIISNLTKGQIKVSKDKHTETFEINGGIVEVLNNQIVILV
jgi:F-type H+-transporting ATPase subunit epsilon